MLPSIKRSWPALALVLLPAGAPAAEDYSEWSHSGDLFLDTSPDGANVAGTVTRFPLLVRLDGTNFDFSQARGNGADIRFASASGKPLPYQIERWDSAGSRAEIWVLADTVHGNRRDQSLRMHWGSASAADSSRGGAVFDTANGFVGVFHLAAEAGTRSNAVATGLAAEPVNYGGYAPSQGVIGHCDSLDNDGTTQDYLALRDDFSVLAKGFTYSVWANPSAVTAWARLVDLGTAAATDNLVLARVGTSDDLSFSAYNGTTRLGGMIIRGALKLDEWQHFAVTVSGRQFRIYRNGDLAGQDSLIQAPGAAPRPKAYIGRSNWPGDPYFQGKVDEPVISSQARSADWIRLSYANQRPGQRLITFRRAVGCQSGFAAPRDTALSEGALLELSARADCASGFTWSALSAMAPRLMDPDVKTLQVFLPRVLQDEVLVYRFTARYGDSVRTKDVRVTVRETIPDPDWSYDPIPPWQGSDTLAISARVSNLAAMRSGRDSLIVWSWTVSGPKVDTAWGAGRLLLWNPESVGPIKVGLCLHNGGAAVCKETLVDLNAATTSARLRPSRSAAAGDARSFRDVSGRLRPAQRRGPGLAAYPDRADRAARADRAPAH